MSATSSAFPRLHRALAEQRLRVKVYAGRGSPLRGKDHYLREIVPAEPEVAKEAEKVRTRET